MWERSGWRRLAVAIAAACFVTGCTGGSELDAASIELSELVTELGVADVEVAEGRDDPQGLFDDPDDFVTASFQVSGDSESVVEEIVAVGERQGYEPSVESAPGQEIVELRGGDVWVVFQIPTGTSPVTVRAAAK